MTGQETVDVLEGVWAGIDALCSQLRDDEWALPTECPGWTVQDNLSHICGTESVLLGRPEPDHVPPPAPHVRNPLGQRNEIQVDHRRSWPPQHVLEEFRELTAERLRGLRAADEAAFAEEVFGPVGPMTLAAFMSLRAFDGWLHEQDIRRATGRHGNLEGIAARLAVERLLLGMPRVVAKHTAEGSVVEFDVDGPVAKRAVIAVVEGRGRRVEDALDRPPTARVVTDTETFVRLCAGRVPGAATLDAGTVRLEGDPAAGRAVVEAMNVLI